MMRSWLPALCVLLAASTVEARSLVSFGAARGGERLQHVLPELGRVVGSLLDEHGLELRAEGRFEELPADRVRLTLTFGGCDAAEEGLLEELDELARRLVDELAQLLAARDKTVAGAADKGAVGADKGDKLDPKGKARVLTPPRPAEHSGLLATRAPLAAVASPPSTLADSPSSPSTLSSPASTPSSPASTPAGTSPASTPSPPATTPSPSSDKTTAVVPVVAPPAPIPAPTPAPAQEELLTPYGSRNSDEPVPARPVSAARVVVHQVAEIPSAYGAGYVATHALFQFLRVKLHLQIVSSGIGMTPLSVAVEEAARAGARATVMVRLIGVDNQPQLDASRDASVHCRLEVVVIRDGRTVLRRLLDGVADQSRDPRRRADPVFFAVTQALESVQSELGTVMAD